MSDIRLKIEEALGLSPIWPNLTKRSCNVEYSATRQIREMAPRVDALYQGYHTADLGTMNRWAELYGVSVEEGDTPCMIRERLSMSVKEDWL